MSTQAAVVFVHGINQTREERAGMKSRFDGHLRRFGVRDLFEQVEAATWRSSGRFDQDIDIMYRVEGLREDAIEDVAEKFRQLSSYPLVIVAHSMGQPLAYLAAQRVQWKVPFSLVSMGGPLGNTNPVVMAYMDWARKGDLTGAREWVDIWNPDDPVCSNLFAPSEMLDHLPAPSAMIRNVLDAVHKIAWSVAPYRAYANARPVKYEYGEPLKAGDRPFKEHSAYFDTDTCFKIIASVRDNLVHD